MEDFLSFIKRNSNNPIREILGKSSKETSDEFAHCVRDIFIKDFRRILKNARSRAKRRSICFNISINHVIELFIHQKAKCELTNSYFFYIYSKSAEDLYESRKMSIDRIDSNKGYTENNIQIVCYWANLAKNNASNEKFHEFICKNDNKFFNEFLDISSFTQSGDKLESDLNKDKIIEASERYKNVHGNSGNLDNLDYFISYLKENLK